MMQIQTQLIYGVDSNPTVVDLIKANNYKHVLVLIDKGVEVSNLYWNSLKELLQEEFDLTIMIAETNSEPTYTYLDELTDQVRKLVNLDVIIGIGGGSTLDLTKAVAALKMNPGQSINYRGFDKVLVASVPTICIPTTAGTGSEATINAVFTDTGENKKLGINGKNMSATYSVLDAKWTENCPKSVALSSGLDALVHTLESFVTWKSNVVTRHFSELAFNKIINNLSSVINGPMDLEAHQNMLLGSYFAGIALFNSGSGISGALSYPIGVLYKVPHGYAGGITLPSVIKFNIDNGWFGYSNLIEDGVVAKSSDPKQMSYKFLDRVNELYEILDVPKNFDNWGLDRTKLDTLMGQFKLLQNAFDQNPINFNAESDARNLILNHLS
jgi:alcohol dehydrogenase class IV